MGGPENGNFPLQRWEIQKSLKTSLRNLKMVPYQLIEIWYSDFIYLAKEWQRTSQLFHFEDTARHYMHLATARIDTCVSDKGSILNNGDKNPRRLEK